MSDQRYNPQMSSLESLAQQVFGELTTAEVTLLLAAPSGQFAVCGPSDKNSDPANYPRNGETWGNERQVRAQLIRWICCTRNASDLVDSKGIQLYGAKLLGVLDLSEVSVPFRVALIHCHATEDILLRGTEIPFLAFDGSWVSGIKADGAEVSGGITFRDGFRAARQVRMHRARIGADLDCSGEHS